MKLSKATLEVLKNFAEINTCFIFNRDKLGYMATASESKATLGFYDLPEGEKEIPEFVVYDLTNLNAILSEFIDDPDMDIDFQDKRMIIKTKTTKLTYYYSSKELIESQFQSPSKTTQKLETSATFKLSPENLARILNMADLLACDHIIFTVKNNMVIASVKDVNNPSSNGADFLIGQNGLANGMEDTFIIHKKDLHLMTKKTYDVFIYGKRAISFVDEAEKRLTYFVAQVSK